MNRVKWVRQQLRTVMLWGFFLLYLSLLKVILKTEKVLTKGLVHNNGPCFDVMFAQLGVIPIIRNKFVEVVAVAEGYLIITHLKKNKESKKQLFRICLPVIIYLSWRKNINKKGRNFFVLSLQYCQFGQGG